MILVHPKISLFCALLDAENFREKCGWIRWIRDTIYRLGLLDENKGVGNAQPEEIMQTPGIKRHYDFFQARIVTILWRL